MGHIILRLDRVMADRKMSLNELSARVGVANVNLSKMKNGHISAIRFSTLAAICDVLNCQPGDILEYSPDEKQIVLRKKHQGVLLRIIQQKQPLTNLVSKPMRVRLSSA